MEKEKREEGKKWKKNEIRQFPSSLKCKIKLVADNTVNLISYIRQTTLSSREGKPIL